MADTSTTPNTPSRAFKSKSVINVRTETIQPANPNLFGLLTPLSPAKNVGSLYNTSTQIDTQVIDNFRNMLLTNHGERLILSDFGADIDNLLTERSSRPDWDQMISTQITATTEKYMPYITIDSVQTLAQPPKNDGFSRVIVGVNFSIPKLGVQNKRIDLTFTNQG
jgi:phage baseplate assembly protein W